MQRKKFTFSLSLFSNILKLGIMARILSIVYRHRISRTEVSKGFSHLKNYFKTEKNANGGVKKSIALTVCVSG